MYEFWKEIGRFDPIAPPDTRYNETVQVRLFRLLD